MRRCWTSTLGHTLLSPHPGKPLQVTLSIAALVFLLPHGAVSASCFRCAHGINTLIPLRCAFRLRVAQLHRWRRMHRPWHPSTGHPQRVWRCEGILHPCGVRRLPDRADGRVGRRDADVGAADPLVAHSQTRPFPSTHPPTLSPACSLASAPRLADNRCRYKIDSPIPIICPHCPFSPQQSPRGCVATTGRAGLASSLA